MPTRPNSRPKRQSKNEAQKSFKAGLKNDRGTLAMARTAVPDSATAQFYINLKSNDALNYPSRDGYGYAVFGKVVKGMDVVDKIAAAPTDSGDAPVDPIVIKDAHVLAGKAGK